MKQLNLDIHEFAEMFPAADRLDYVNLTNDIRRHGVQVPIVLFEGKILDGRSRYEIAKTLKMPFKTVDFNGTAKNALQLVASYNLYRRHLQPSQKAMVASDIAERLAEIDGLPKCEAKEIATNMTGAAKSTVDRASRIKEANPEVAEKIRNGSETIGGHLGRSKTKCPICGHEW